MYSTAKTTIVRIRYNVINLSIDFDFRNPHFTEPFDRSSSCRSLIHDRRSLIQLKTGSRERTTNRKESHLRPGR